MFDFLKTKPVVLKDDSREVAQLKEQVIKLQETNATLKQDNEISTKSLKAEQTIEINKLKAENEIALKEKEFEIKTKTAEDVLKLTAENVELAKQVAVANESIKQLDRIIDLDGDILDVKDLVSKLIMKLPTVNIGGNLVADTKSKEDKKS